LTEAVARRRSLGIFGGAMEKRLLPREHGAYAELGFPLLSGLVLGSPGPAAFLFAGAAIALFLAHEPLAVLLGVRGRRPREELGGRARRLLSRLVPFGAVAGIAALWLAPAPSRGLALLPAGIAALLVPVALAKNLKTLPAEVVAAAAFSAMHLPVAAAGGVSGLLLWGPAAMWFATAVVATLGVHAIKARVTGAAPWVVPLASWASLLALPLAIALALWVPEWRRIALAASLPLAAVALVNVLRVSPRKLKPVGWTLVAANAAAVAVLAAASGGS